MTGAFISLEGADGAGKTTHLALIIQTLQEHGIDVVQTREPGGTPLGEQIRETILSSDIAICHDAELMLMFAARIQHLSEKIIPALETDKWVVSDRFTDASYAYQGSGRGISMQRIEALEEWMLTAENMMGSGQPDLTLVLDVPVEVGLERSNSRDAEADRFEQQANVFKEKVRQCYLQRAQAYPERIQVIDSSQSLDRVQSDVKHAIEAFVKSWKKVNGTV